MARYILISRLARCSFTTWFAPAAQWCHHIVDVVGLLTELIFLLVSYGIIIVWHPVPPNDSLRPFKHHG
jgi:hypothetical protein